MKRKTAKERIPKALSKGEECFALHCQAYNLKPEREYRFAGKKRRWRFDFAFPTWKIAVEVEGGTWINGRHNRGSSIEADYEKYNYAAKEEWLVLRFTTRMVEDGRAIHDVLEMVQKLEHIDERI